MIVGIFLRYIKTYRGINYVPITAGDTFCGLVGENGIGKSSVLEALDSFFNARPITLNIHTKRSGLRETHPHIVPIFAVEKAAIPTSLHHVAEILDKLASTVTEVDVPMSSRPHVKKFIAHRKNFSTNVGDRDRFILPLGVDHDGDISISVFNCKLLVQLLAGEGSDPSITSLSASDLNNTFRSLLDAIRSLFDYIYIPKEIDSESFTKLETQEIQSLMGESLTDILSSRVTASLVQEINRNLNEFIDNLSDELSDYAYRTPTDRQQNLKRQDLYNLIIEAFFNIRKLHKRQGESWLEIRYFSSGEKQKAIIDIAHSLITQHRHSAKNVILAVDEPESSLHMSACFDQFDKLHSISKYCRQVLFSTHWYGFFPAMETGYATVISKTDGEHSFDLISLGNHREQIRQMSTASNGSLPFDVRLKSINDFVQSLLTSAVSSEPYNWLICEGSSEKIYFTGYLHDLVEKRRLRIVPVGGAKEIKKIYQYLLASYDDIKNEIRGTIVLISDTDDELVHYETLNLPNLVCKRIVNTTNPTATRLVNVSSNPMGPKTCIEDVLDANAYRRTLEFFSGEYPELSFVSHVDIDEEAPSGLALDLKRSQMEHIQKFFSGENKYRFAQKYVEIMDDESVPEWIKELRGFLIPKPTRTKRGMTRTLLNE